MVLGVKGKTFYSSLVALDLFSTALIIVSQEAEVRADNTVTACDNQMCKSSETGCGLNLRAHIAKPSLSSLHLCFGFLLSFFYKCLTHFHLNNQFKCLRYHLNKRFCSAASLYIRLTTCTEMFCISRIVNDKKKYKFLVTQFNIRTIKLHIHASNTHIDTHLLQ